MKKAILGTLLVGTFALQSAYAKVRTFDFSANVSTLVSLGNSNASSGPGVFEGTTVTLGDLITGQFSFDDGGHDWTNAITPITSPNVVGFKFFFNASNTGFDVDINTGTATWSHAPFFFDTSAFTIAGVDAEHLVSGSFVLNQPAGNFGWELNTDTIALLGVRWLRPGGEGRLNANVTSLVEVSPVPEPSSYAMLLLGAAVIGGVRRLRAARRAV